MEGIDLVLLIQIFKGFKSTLPHPAPPRRFCQSSRGGPGQDLLFAGQGSPFFRGAGRGGTGRSAHPCQGDSATLNQVIRDKANASCDEIWSHFILVKVWLKPGSDPVSFSSNLGCFPTLISQMISASKSNQRLNDNSIVEFKFKFICGTWFHLRFQWAASSRGIKLYGRSDNTAPPSHINRLLTFI